MSDITPGPFPRSPRAAHPHAIDDGALMRILRFRDRLSQGEMPELLAPMLCATLPDIVEELLAHRRDRVAMAARHDRLTRIEDAAGAAEGLAREAIDEATKLDTRLHEVELAMVELARRCCAAPLANPTTDHASEACHGNHA